MTSEFQFTNPILSKIEFLYNKEFNAWGDEVPIKMELSVKVSKGEDKNKAIVSLVCELGEKNNLSPFWLLAEEEATFKWEEAIEQVIVEKLLKQNAPSLLLSYLRPIVVQVTQASPCGAYNIPFMNFSKP